MGQYIYPERGHMSIEEIFKTYTDTVYPGRVGPGKYHELKMAFYAGFGAMQQVMIEIGDDSVSEEDGVRILDRFVGEMRDYHVQVAQDSRNQSDHQAH